MSKKDYMEAVIMAICILITYTLSGAITWNL